jgi:hypothetical protein
VGEFKDDKPNGQGTYSFPGGAKYVGEIKDGFYAGKSPFAQDCVVGLGGLELLTKRLLPRHD